MRASTEGKASKYMRYKLCQITRLGANLAICVLLHTVSVLHSILLTCRKRKRAVVAHLDWSTLSLCGNCSSHKTQIKASQLQSSSTQKALYNLSITIKLLFCNKNHAFSIILISFLPFSPHDFSPAHEEGCLTFVGPLGQKIKDENKISRTQTDSCFTGGFLPCSRPGGCLARRATPSFFSVRLAKPFLKPNHMVPEGHVDRAEFTLQSKSKLSNQPH